ncbi:MAG: hypothetical protein ACRCTY_08770, partial [Candidatus Adiutrix sp.]
MSGDSLSKYGHQKIIKGDTRRIRWLIMGFILLWVFIICANGAGRMAIVIGLQEEFQEPLLAVGNFVFYWPWKLIGWSNKFYQNHAEISRILDETYLLGMGLPFAIFVGFLAVQKTLKGREDLH